MSGYVVHGVEGDSSGLCRSYATDSRCTSGGEGGESGPRIFRRGQLLGNSGRR